MANVLKPSSGPDKGQGNDSDIALTSGESSTVLLWGGGPKGEALDVSCSPGSLVDIIELPDSASHTRRFRLVAQGIGSGKLEARLGPTGPLSASMDVSVAIGPPRLNVGNASLTFDGQNLRWLDKGKSYKATSGLPDGKDDPQDYRFARLSCVKDHGPVPEGSYSFSTKVDAAAYAKDSGRGTCTLDPGSDIQKIPRDAAAGRCEPFWANWGENRVRLEAVDTATKHACTPERDGFYLHDSTKGFSHGCIEVEGRFFTDLRDYAKTSKGKRLILTIRYLHGSTYGGTKKP